MWGWFLCSSKPHVVHLPTPEYIPLGDENVSQSTNRRYRTERRSIAPVMVNDDGPDEFRRAHNISKGGLCLSTDKDVDVGDQVSLRLQFPDLWVEIELDARAVWVSEAGEVGVEILGLTETASGQLELLIAEQERYGKMALLC